MKSIIIIVISLIFVSRALEHCVVSASASTLSRSRFLRSLAKAETSDDERSSIEEIDILHDSFLMNRFTERPLNEVADKLNKHNEVADKLNKHNEALSLYKYLHLRYVDEELFREVSTSLRNADHSSESTRSKLRTNHIADMVKRKIDPATVLQYVWPKGEDGVDLMDKGSLHSWLLYLRAYSENDVDGFKTTIQTMLTWEGGRDKVVQLIYRIEKSDESNAQELVNKLKEPLLQKWEGDHKTIKQVFTELSIQENNPRSNAPIVNMWLSYVEKNNDDDSFVELVKELKPPAFYQVFIATTRFSRLHNLLNQQVELVTNSLKYLMEGKESPEDAFFIFGLDYDKNTLLTNSHFNDWQRIPIKPKQNWFMEKLQKLSRDSLRYRFSWPHILEKYFGYSGFADIITKGMHDPKTSLASLLTKDLWLVTKRRENENPVDFFKKLDFNDVGDYVNLLVDPKFKLWFSYVQLFNEREHYTIVINSLLSSMALKDVVHVLEIGLKHSESAELAATLQNKLFELWRKEGYQVSTLEHDINSNVIVNNYKEFLK